MKKSSAVVTSRCWTSLACRIRIIPLDGSFMLDLFLEITSSTFKKLMVVAGLRFRPIKYCCNYMNDRLHVHITRSHQGMEDLGWIHLVSCNWTVCLTTSFIVIVRSFFDGTVFLDQFFKDSMKWLDITCDMYTIFDSFHIKTILFWEVTKVTVCSHQTK